MTVCLISGAGGFLGRHLCAALTGRFELVGVDQPGVPIVPGFEWRVTAKPTYLAKLVKEIKPDLVIHTAFVNRKPPEQTDEQYLLGRQAVDLPLLAVLTELNSRILLISSSAIYGPAGGSAPITEQTPCRPISLYGLAKLFQEHAARYYAQNGLGLSIVRLFNLVGPGQPLGLLWADWISRVRAMAAGQAEELTIRHSQTSRDFVDVRDAARFIGLAATDFRVGKTFNVASGQAVSLSEILSELRTISGIDFRVRETAVFDPRSEVLTQAASIDLAQSEYDWRPEILWHRSLRDQWQAGARMA